MVKRENVKFSLYLIDHRKLEEFQFLEKDYYIFLKEEVRQALENDEGNISLSRYFLNKNSIEGLKGTQGNPGEIFVFKTVQSTPLWIDHINKLSRKKVQISKNVSNKAVVFMEINSSIFAISFGRGISFVDEKFIVKDFGFKISKKILNIDKLDNINSMVLGEKFLNTKKQSNAFIPVSKLIEPNSYTMVKDINGRTEDGFYIGGNNSISFSGKLNLLNELVPLINKFMEKYIDNSSYGLEFDNKINKVSEKEIIETLNYKIIKKIIKVKDSYNIKKELNGSDLKSLEFSPKLISDIDKVSGYLISGVSYNKPTHELNKEDYFLKLSKHLISKNLGNLEEKEILQKLKRDKIKVIYENGDIEVLDTIFNTLFFETTLDFKMYILLSGKWFSVDKDFYKSLKDEIDSIPIYQSNGINFYEYNSTKHNAEEDYNEEIAERNSKVDCLDQVFHTFPEEIKKAYDFNGYSKLEPCDLLFLSDNTFQFIHVKRGKKASDMSHLFAQGYASAKLLIGDKKIIEHINKNIKKTPQISYEIRPNEIEVVFAIILSKNEMKLKNSKLFTLLSMLTISATLRSLSELGFKYSMKRIVNSSPKKVKS